MDCDVVRYDNTLSAQRLLDDFGGTVNQPKRGTTV